MSRFKDLFSFYSVRHQKIAKMSEENPGITPAIIKMCEGILRVCEEEGLNPAQIGFKVNMISNRRCMLTITTPKEHAADLARARQRRHVIDEEKQAELDEAIDFVVRKAS